MPQIQSLKTENKFKKTEIGEIPVDWDLAAIGDVAKAVGGSTPSTKRKDFWNGNIPWAVPTDITALHSNLISTTERNITEEGLKNCAATLLPAGSILLTSRATIGECAINEVPMATHQGFSSLICNDRVHNWFLFYVIKLFKNRLENLASGSTFRKISKKSLRSVKIPLPPFEEQKKIAEILLQADKEIEEETAQKATLENLKKGLMQVLLTGKIRVKR